MITFDDFKKVEIKAGKILSAEKIPNTDKLLKLLVDFGEKKEITPATVPETALILDQTDNQTEEKIIVPTPRQIISGISSYFPDPAVLVGKTCMFVTNLEPRVIKGLQSNGMLFALSDDKGNFSLLEPNSSIQPGTIAI